MTESGGWSGIFFELLRLIPPPPRVLLLTSRESCNHSWRPESFASLATAFICPSAVALTGTSSFHLNVRGTTMRAGFNRNGPRFRPALRSLWLAEGGGYRRPRQRWSERLGDGRFHQLCEPHRHLRLDADVRDLQCTRHRLLRLRVGSGSTAAPSRESCGAMISRWSVCGQRSRGRVRSDRRRR